MYTVSNLSDLCQLNSWKAQVKRRGYLSIAVALVVVFIGILAGSVLFNVSIIHNVKADQLRAECSMIDRSLEMWSKSHRAIKKETIQYPADGRVSYEKKRVYPASLEELKELGYVWRGMDGSIFRYSTEGSDTGYHLEVDLPMGVTYVSPGSTY